MQRSRSPEFSHHVSSDKLPTGMAYRLRKLRLWFAWPFFLALLVYAKSTSAGFGYGMPIIGLGELIRIWSHGFLMKTRRLATDGPYAYVRNPLYVGNFLIGFGFCVVIWNVFVVSLFVIFFFVVYGVTVKGEEERLAFRFGNTYEEYVRHVPCFLPRLTPYPKREGAGFAFYRVWGHGEANTMVSIILLLTGLWLRQELYQNREPLSEFTMILAVCAVILAVTLLYIFVARKVKGRRTKRKLAS